MGWLARFFGLEKPPAPPEPALPPAVPLAPPGIARQLDEFIASHPGSSYAIRPTVGDEARVAITVDDLTVVGRGATIGGAVLAAMRLAEAALAVEEEAS